MPDLTPSLDILRQLGLSAPPESEPIPIDKRKIYDEVVRNSQSKDPDWKKAARTGLSIVGGATRGLLGSDPQDFDTLRNRVLGGNASLEDKAGYYANEAGQMINSGGLELGAGLSKAGLPLKVSQFFMAHLKFLKSLIPMFTILMMY